MKAQKKTTWRHQSFLRLQHALSISRTLSGARGLNVRMDFMWFCRQKTVACQPLVRCFCHFCFLSVFRLVLFVVWFFFACCLAIALFGWPWLVAPITRTRSWHFFVLNNAWRVHWFGQTKKMFVCLCLVGCCFWFVCVSVFGVLFFDFGHCPALGHMSGCIEENFDQQYLSKSTWRSCLDLPYRK